MIATTLAPALPWATIMSIALTVVRAVFFDMLVMPLVNLSRLFWLCYGLDDEVVVTVMKSPEPMMRLLMPAHDACATVSTQCASTSFASKVLERSSQLIRDENGHGSFRAWAQSLQLQNSRFVPTLPSTKTAIRTQNLTCGRLVSYLDTSLGFLGHIGPNPPPRRPGKTTCSQLPTEKAAAKSTECARSRSRGLGWREKKSSTLAASRFVLCHTPPHSRSVGAMVARAPPKGKVVGSTPMRIAK
ncbi:hypothetical protein IWZ00DRAFT_574388 [Phyllosticta capitalensis]|uniref:Secreted protein n=1 Tax=Phyllosticta capitalensis TaxID=121624 RepID=A0ABR1YH62_9PEZI